MVNENDRFLELILEGNTLGGLKLLQSAGADPGSESLAVNQLLYGPPSMANQDLVKVLEEDHLQRLDNLNDRGKATAFHNLGCFSLFQDEILDARMRFSEALKLEPDNLMARHNLGYAYELMAELDEARAAYEQVLRQNSKCVLTRLNLAQLKLQEGDYEGGLEDLDALYREQPDNISVVLYLCRGLLLRASSGDIDRVLELIGSVPDAGLYSDLQECRAYALFLLGDLEEAETAFKDLLYNNQDNLFAHLGMIKVLGQKRDSQSLTAHVERCQLLNPTEKMARLLDKLIPAD